MCKKYCVKFKKTTQFFAFRSIFNMAESYGNNEYPSYEEERNFGKSKKSAGVPAYMMQNGDTAHHDHQQASGGGPPLSIAGQPNEKAREYLHDCLTEKTLIDKKFPIAEKLLDSEIEKVQSSGRIFLRENKYADIYREKPLRISQKVLVPVREHPKFNFVGKLLGPKGNSLRRLQEDTLCKMTVLGRNSMRDRVKEEELRASNDPKYSHLNSDLHVEISTIASPAEAYARIAYAMAELRKYLIPDSNDIIRQEQLRELMDSTSLHNDETKNKNVNCNQANNSSNANSGYISNVSGGNSGSGRAAGHEAHRNQNLHAKNAVAPKQKVMSILEKARTAMEETYSRNFEGHQNYGPQYNHYGHEASRANVPQIPHPSGNVIPKGPYDTHEYSANFNRRDYFQHSPVYGAGSAALPQTQVKKPSTDASRYRNR